MATIAKDSEAFKRLSEMLLDPDTHKVSIEVRNGGKAIALKQNEKMWTPSLGVNKYL